jgi:hypothetical protein
MFKYLSEINFLVQYKIGTQHVFYMEYYLNTISSVIPSVVRIFLLMKKILTYTFWFF